MRKSQKKQAEGFLGLLAQAHNEFRLAIEQKKTSVALSLLADCQDGAIALGDFIEKAEGEACKTIHILEEYCELVYQIHEEITQEALACEKQFVNEKQNINDKQSVNDKQSINEKQYVNEKQSINGKQSVNRKQYADGKQNANGNHHIDGNKIYKSLCRMFHNIENSIQNDIKVRLEAVFLPYKASMWDSLESIWKAAEEDTDCDAYVIPIPYYDKKPDGSFGEIHYEGSQYPEYVPVTWYEDYDFEKRKPDMIFIHNPYDEYNYVTSVSPFFYSKNLKKFTNKLVYVPYFILGEMEPENEEAVKGIAHFCTVPGVLYADKVIVQSEKMRQIYIKVMTNYMAGHQGYGKQYWEEKILGLGSPKVDKVLSTRKEELEIPEEWLRVIEKPDGSWKKIVFYNTSVTALLEHNEKMLEKIQNVFRVFQENKDEVALLWRPHPLIQATISSMRPQLWRKYQEMVNKYKKEGWGIYDDSEDMDRAIVLSDAYYGDSSSVLILCKKKHMLVMKQDVKYLEKRELPYYKQLFARKFFAAMGKVGDVLYFSQITGNKLITYDIATGEYKIVSAFYGEPEAEIDLFIDIVQFEEKLYMIPESANAIYEYDLMNGKMQNYSIKMLDYKMRIRQKFSGAVVWNNELILIPWRYPAIIRFHLKNKTMVYETGYIGVARKLHNGLGECGRKSCVFHDKLYMVISGTDQVIQYGLNDRMYKVISLEKPGIAFQVLCSDERSIWAFAAKEKSIVRLYPDEKKEEYRGYPDNYEEIYPSVRSAVDTGKSIWCFPLLSNMVLNIDKENGHITELKEIPQSNVDERKRCGRYIFSKRIGNEVYAMDSMNGNLQIIDIPTCKVNTIVLQNFHGWNDDSFVKEHSSYWIEEMEEEMISLSDFIGIIAEGKEAKDTDKDECVNCAMNIYQQVKKL